MKRICICVPSMEFVTAGFAQSLAELSFNSLGMKDTLIATIFEVGSLIYEARNNLVKKALRDMGADFLLWLDSDMIFKPDTLIKLLDHDADFVSGLYFRRSPPYAPVVFSEVDMDRREWKGLNKIPEKTFEAEAVGFGCALVKAEVFADVAVKFRNWFEPMNGFGEDLAFCWRARQCGYKILVDPDIECGHYAHMIVDSRIYKAFNKGLQ